MSKRTSPLRLEQHVQSPHQITYDIYLDQTMIGCLLYEQTFEGFPYLYVSIQESYRQKGYGSQALRDVISMWNKMGIEAYTFVVEQNSIAEKIVEKYTYDVVGYHDENGKRMWHCWVQCDTAKHNYVYMLRCTDGSLYTGWTNHLEQRFRAHRCGKGAKYTHAYPPTAIVYTEAYLTKKAAMKREYAIKQCTKEEKERLISSWRVG